ncbi:MAG: hypothetical protein ACOYEV_00985 [Candidatus Nanopelagicales bacterium]
MPAEALPDPASVLRQLRNPDDDTYSIPSLDRIRRLGKLDSGGQEEWLAAAEQAGKTDVDNDLLRPPIPNLHNVEQLLYGLDLRFDKVVVDGGDLVRQHLKLANSVLRGEADQLDQADSATGPSSIQRAKYDKAAATAEVRSFAERGTRSRGLAVALLLGTVAALFVDSALFGRSILSTEQFDTRTSYLLGVAITGALALFSAISGGLFARAQPTESIADSDVPMGMDARHGNAVENTRKRNRQYRVFGVLVMLTVLVALAIIYRSRLLQVSETDFAGTAGKLLLAAIIVLAGASLFVFWYEGFERGIRARYKAAHIGLVDAQKALDLIGDEPGQKQAFVAQIALNEAQMHDEPVSARVDAAVEGIVPLFERTVKAYILGANSALAQIPSEDLRAEQQTTLPYVGSLLLPLDQFYGQQLRETNLRQDRRRSISAAHREQNESK